MPKCLQSHGRQSSLPQRDGCSSKPSCPFSGSPGAPCCCSPHTYGARLPVGRQRAPSAAAGHRCWHAGGGSLIVPSNAGEAAQPLHPTSLTSPCHAPTGACAGLSQTCFGGPQHNTGFIRASPGALIWDTPQQPVMNPHTRVRVQRGGERSQLYPVYRVAASFMSRLKASWPAPAQE